VCPQSPQYSPTGSDAGNVNNGGDVAIRSRIPSHSDINAAKVFIFTRNGFQPVSEVHRSDRRTGADEFSKTVDADPGAITTSRRLCSQMRATGRS
jgi:hypothetical protein